MSGSRKSRKLFCTTMFGDPPITSLDLQKFDKDRIESWLTTAIEQAYRAGMNDAYENCIQATLEGLKT